MRKPVEDNDWYVDLSERLERSERRRKWVILATLVAVPLVLMGMFLLYMWLDGKGVLPRWKGFVKAAIPERAEAVKATPIGPVSVLSLHKSDIRFPQLDSQGIITTLNHFFRELKPEKAEAFTVNRETDDAGTLLVYRLMDLGTTLVYEFSDVPVKRIAGEWIIAEEGWTALRKELQAKLNVSLGLPQL